MDKKRSEKTIRVWKARNAAFAGTVRKLLKIDRTEPRFVCDPFVIRQIDTDRAVNVGVVAASINNKRIPVVFEDHMVRDLLGSLPPETCKNRSFPTVKLAEATLKRPPLALRLDTGAIILLDGVKRLVARSDQNAMVRTAVITERALVEKVNDGRGQDFIVPIGRYRDVRKRVIALPRLGGIGSPAPGIFFEYLALRPQLDPRLHDAYVLNAAIMKRMISRLRPSDNASILEALKSKSRGFAKVDVDLGAVANEINDLLKLPGAESEIDISGVSCSTDSPTGLVSAGEAVQDFRGKSSTTIDTYRRRIAKEYAAADESLKDTPVFSSVVQNDLQGLSISDGYREFISKFGLMTDDLRSEDLFEENIRGLLFRRDLHIILSRACYASDLIEYIDNQVAESANGKYHLLTQAAETLEKAWNSGRCVLSIKQVTLIALLYGIDVSYSQRQIIVHSGAISWFQFRYGVFLADFSITEHMVEEFVHHMRLRTEGAVYDGSELWDEIFKGFSGEWFGTDVTASIARICAEGVNISVPSGSREAAETLMKSLPASFKVKFDPWAASRQRKGSRGAPRFPRPGG